MSHWPIRRGRIGSGTGWGWGKSSTLRNGMFLFAVKATAKIKYKSIE